MSGNNPLQLTITAEYRRVRSSVSSTDISAHATNQRFRLMDRVDFDLQEVVKRLATEASIPTTRMNAVVALVELFPKVSNEQKEALIQNVLRTVIHDKSDEVRVLLAGKMPKIQASVGYPVMKTLVKFVVGHIEKGGTKVK